MTKSEARSDLRGHLEAIMVAIRVNMQMDTMVIKVDGFKCLVKLVF